MVVSAGIQDSQCGFKMFSARAAETVLPLVTLDGWAFDLEVLAIARARGLRIAELPVGWHYRPESRVRLVQDGWCMCCDAWRIRARLRRGDYTRA